MVCVQITESENTMSETNVAGAFLKGNEVWLEMWDGTQMMFQVCAYLSKAEYCRDYLNDEFSKGARVLVGNFGDGIYKPILDGRTVTDFWS
jgi:hypothetical protein